MSTILAKVTHFHIVWPETAVDWAALLASICTIIYVASKIFLLWKNAGKTPPPAD